LQTGRRKSLQIQEPLARQERICLLYLGTEAEVVVVALLQVLVIQPAANSPLISRRGDEELEREVG
jgi:hypothetical protein